MRNPVKYLKALVLKSALIQLRIDDEMRARKPDDLRLLMLKKQRLMVKDAIVKLKQRYRRHQRKNKHQVMA